MTRLPTLAEMGLVIDARPQKMRGLDDTLTAIGYQLKADGHWHAVEDVVRKHRPAGAKPTMRSKTRTLADLRAFMLEAGYPVRRVQAFDR